MLLFLCQAYPGDQASLVSGNNQPWDNCWQKAMVTLTSVELTLPHEVQGCCSCVKHALVTRRVLYQEIISSVCRKRQSRQWSYGGSPSKECPSHHMGRFPVQGHVRPMCGITTCSPPSQAQAYPCRTSQHFCKLFRNATTPVKSGTIWHKPHSNSSTISRAWTQ